MSRGHTITGFTQQTARYALTDPYGNANSPVKIAYILGVHPREKGSHEKLEKALLNKSSNLSYCYYIYKINVTKDTTDYVWNSELAS